MKTNTQTDTPETDAAALLSRNLTSEDVQVTLMRQAQRIEALNERCGHLERALVDVLAAVSQDSAKQPL